jgi:hypothetical protein
LPPGLLLVGSGSVGTELLGKLEPPPFAILLLEGAMVGWLTVALGKWLKDWKELELELEDGRTGSRTELELELMTGTEELETSLPRKELELAVADAEDELRSAELEEMIEELSVLAVLLAETTELAEDATDEVADEKTEELEDDASQVTIALGGFSKTGISLGRTLEQSVKPWIFCTPSSERRRYARE